MVEATIPSIRSAFLQDLAEFFWFLWKTSPKEEKKL
jgi:hypothetical protein